MFNLKGDAELLSIKVGRAKKDNAVVRATLVALFVDQDVEAAAAVLGAEYAHAASLSFHNTDADGDRRFFGIDHIVTNVKFGKRHAFTVPGFANLRVESVKKIHLTPVAHKRWNVQCNVLIESPPPGFVDLVAEIIGELVKMELAQDADLFVNAASAQSIVDRVTELYAEAVVDRIKELHAKTADPDSNVIVSKAFARRRSWNERQAEHEAAHPIHPQE